MTQWNSVQRTIRSGKTRHTTFSRLSQEHRPSPRTSAHASAVKATVEPHLYMQDKLRG
jgi:hypothetical protein